MKVKALILLVIFIMNTVIGFNCALHTQHQESAEISEHHSQSKHIALAHPELNSNRSIVATTDICCGEAVNKFILQAKQIPVNNSVLLLVSFIYVSHPIDFFFKSLPYLHLSKPSVTGLRLWPPIKDIRIIIQSFLI